MTLRSGVASKITRPSPRDAKISAQGGFIVRDFIICLFFRQYHATLMGDKDKVCELDTPLADGSYCYFFLDLDNLISKMFKHNLDITIAFIK